MLGRSASWAIFSVVTRVILVGFGGRPVIFLGTPARLGAGVGLCEWFCSLLLRNAMERAALLSLGESWHNMHHSDPACVRHGADPRQIEISPPSSASSSAWAGPPACTGLFPPAWSATAAIRASTSQRRYSRQRGADLAGTDLTVNVVHYNVNNVARN